jgi:hypothetical protein
MTVADDDARRRFGRRLRYQLRDELRAVSQFDRVKMCGRRMTGTQVALVKGLRGAGYAGVSYCGGIWTCPVCSAVIRQRRAQEIETGLMRHLDAGGGGAFVTATIPHKYADDLQETLDVVLKGWGSTLRNRVGRELLARIGVVGTIKAVETTHGVNGWHPHLHIVVLTERPLTGDQVAAFHAELESAWLEWAKKRGWSAPSEKYGVNVSNLHISEKRVDGVAVARYLAKVQDGAGNSVKLGLEMARGDLKAGRRKGSTPFELLGQYRDARLAGEKKRQRRLVALWRTYETATRGKHALVWSNGLKARLGIDQVTDQQLVDQVANEGAEPVLFLDRSAWVALGRASARALLLDVAETAGAAAARAFMTGLLNLDQEELHESWQPPADWREHPAA